MTTHICEDCDKVCADHSTSLLRITSLENSLSVVTENTFSVNKLSTRVNLLMSLMGIAVAVTTAAATYSFTALTSFKEQYAHDSLQLQKQMSGMESGIDTRLDSIEKRLTTIEVTTKLTTARTVIQRPSIHKQYDSIK